MKLTVASLRHRTMPIQLTRFGVPQQSEEVSGPHDAFKVGLVVQRF
jgi:hypothetical protein